MYFSTIMSLPLLSPTFSSQHFPSIVQEGDEKKDTIDKQPADDTASIAESPITDPTSDKSNTVDESADVASGDKRDITTTTTPTPTTQSTDATTTPEEKSKSLNSVGFPTIYYSLNFNNLDVNIYGFQ